MECPAETVKLSDEKARFQDSFVETKEFREISRSLMT